MKVTVYNTSGKSVDEVELSAEVFEAKINRALMHQALVRQLSNKRQGTHKTQTRSEVSRTTAKMYRQKGTGNARHGSRRAPIFVGGGVAHGPKPRKYIKRMPRKMRHAALRSALSVKAQNGDIVVLDQLQMEEPKTKSMNNVLQTLIEKNSALVLLGSRNENVEKSVRNLAHAKALHAGYLNIRDLLGYDKIVMPLEALKAVEAHLEQTAVVTDAYEEQE